MEIWYKVYLGGVRGFGISWDRVLYRVQQHLVQGVFARSMRGWYMLGQGFCTGYNKIWYQVYLLGVRGSGTRLDSFGYKLGQGCVHGTSKFGTRCILGKKTFSEI